MAKSPGPKNGKARESQASGSKKVQPRTLIWALVAVAIGAVVLFGLLQPADQADTSNGTGAGGAGTASSGVGLMTVDAAGVLAAQKDGVRVIDVRSEAEYEGGHVPGAENVPIDQFAQAIQGWDKTVPVLIYCATGSRSSQAVGLLQQAGFTSIYHFDRGMQAWSGQVETGQSAATPTPTPKPTATPVMYEFYTDS